jgi:hypothetical protein
MSRPIAIRCASRGCLEAASIPLGMFQDYGFLLRGLHAIGWTLAEAETTSQLIGQQSSAVFAPLCGACSARLRRQEQPGGPGRILNV